MRRMLVLLVFVGVSALPASAIDFYISPDVPTDDPSALATIFLPWEIVRVNGAALSYNLTWSLPPTVALDALHETCVGDWLFSVEAPTDLGGTTYLPEDVIRVDAAATYSYFFCGAAVGLPAGVDVDAAFLVPPGDSGDLVLSFDVPTDLTALGGALYEPADLVRFVRMAPGCAGWVPLAVPYFDASTTAPPVPIEVNVTGADERFGRTVLTFDVPVDLTAVTQVPGELVAWDGVVFSSVHLDPSWPLSSRADALSFLADPGTVPGAPPSAKIHLSKAAGSQITIQWSPSSSAGAEDYAIYQGSLVRPWAYNHAWLVCTDAGVPFTETFVPQAADSYYLVVALNANDEGSYGKNDIWYQIPTQLERPQGSPACRTTQALDCP